jgi:hypothetical protein
MIKLISIAAILAVQNGWTVAVIQTPNGVQPQSISSAPPLPPKALTVSMIYTASNLRDPFRNAAAGVSVTRKAFKPSDFNIHNLNLRGLMADSKSNYALLIDANYGESFILQGGKLYDPKGKPVPGISGRLDTKRKTVYIKAHDGDVQVLRMGEKNARMMGEKL